MATRRYEGPSGTQIQTTAGDVLKAAEAIKAAIEADFAKRLETWRERYDARQREIKRIEDEDAQAKRYANAQFHNELNAWNALPWLLRLITLKPIKVEVWPRSTYSHDDYRIALDKPYPHDYPALQVADELVKAMSPLPPETLVMIDANDAALIGLGATTETKEAK
jgi:hypothetical protein